jgi:hypothetical protein
LRPQLPFFRVAAAHQHEAGRVPNGQALPLDHVLAGCCDVDQQIDQVVLQQVHLVDIQEPPVRPRQQAGFEGPLPLGQRPLQV